MVLRITLGAAPTQGGFKIFWSKERARALQRGKTLIERTKLGTRFHNRGFRRKDSGNEGHVAGLVGTFEKQDLEGMAPLNHRTSIAHHE